MSENNPQTNDYIQFLDRENPEENVYVSFSFNVKVTDSLLMYHICHLYHNCQLLIEKGEMTEDEIDDYISIEYILKSVQEALDSRIKCLDSSYIDEAYKWCLDKPKHFDICLDYFKKLKVQVTEIHKIYEDKVNQQKMLKEIDFESQTNLN